MENKVKKYGPLTPGDIAILNRVKKDPENQSAKSSETDRKSMVTIITEKTAKALRGLLNMSDDLDMDLPNKTPDYVAGEMTEKFLNNLKQDEDTSGTKSLRYQIIGWNGPKFSGREDMRKENSRDAAIVGCTLVFIAFEAELGDEFISNLRKIHPKEIMVTFDECKAEVATDPSSLADRSNSTVGIPENQIYLNGVIGELADLYSGPYGPQVRCGADLAFGVIDKLWSKLRPGANKTF